MQADELSALQMLWLYGLVLPPLALLAAMGFRLGRDIVVSVLRMSVQLGLVGVYLNTLFALNHPLLNGLWVLVMLVVAGFSILKRAGLGWRPFFPSTFVAISVATVAVTVYLVAIVIQAPNIYDAHYLVPLAGMVLGNCLQGNVIALERFYAALRKNEQEYLTFLLLGASRWEAVRPYFVEAVTAALSPTIASMATMGLVALPGMMTGQILGGSDPLLAVKYQVAIMVCIFASTTIACLLNLKLSLPRAFNSFDVLNDHLKHPGKKKEG